jgi:2-dehydro-3-deoxygluconokinase
MFKEPGPGNTTRVFYYRRQSAAALRSEQFDSLNAKYLFVTGITPALSDSNRHLTFELVERFRAAGTKVAFDPNMRFRLWSPSEARIVFLELARKCDILIPSLAETEIMTGLKQGEGESMLDALVSLGPPQVVLKAGDKGAWYADGAERGFCPCHSVLEIDPWVLETRSAQGSFPDCSTANLSGTRSHGAPLLARSASLRSVTTRGYPTGQGSKHSRKGV